MEVVNLNKYMTSLEKENEKLKNEIKNYIPKSKIKDEILYPMKEEHDKAIENIMKKERPYIIEDGAVAQTLGHFIGKIEELLEDK